MESLAVVNDVPPNNIQPTLQDGIHLRWAFKGEIGFPWHGYYLFRRRARQDQGTCLEKIIRPLELPPGPWTGKILNTSIGQIVSDQNLAFTDDFPPSITVEFDLSNRSFLRFVLPPNVLTCMISVRVGFRQDAKIVVTALSDNVPAKRVVLEGLSGQIVEQTLEFSTISAVEFGSGPAALIDLCYVPISEDLRGWEKLPNFPYPLCLPVANSDYPCTSKPSTKAQAEAMAIGRILYGYPNDWRGDPFDGLYHQLEALVRGGPPPIGTPMSDREEQVSGSPIGPPGPGDSMLAMPHQRPLDLVLLGSLNPAIAQMIGLYWIDTSASRGIGYDYIILADHAGIFNGDPDTALNWLVSSPDFTKVDGYIEYNVSLGSTTTPALQVPKDVRVYALPGGTLLAAEGHLVDSTNNAGLRWNIEYSSEGILLPDRPVLYHLWRADLGTSEPAAGAVPSADKFKVLTEKRPILIVRLDISPEGKTPQYSSDWPPFMLHAIDRALVDGWYSYQVSGIDIFGRHSSNSSAAEWYQWTPMPNPRPWYYRDPSVESMIHPFAIGLLDKIPPPPPTGIEAYALDPQDPTVLKDAAYNAWYDTLSVSEKTSVIGLRVRWAWTHSHMQQAPDVREFRIYFNPGRFNALIGNIANVAHVSEIESLVETDIPNTQPSDTYSGAWLRIGSHSFKIIGSNAGSSLSVRVKNIGAENNIRPRSNALCAIVIPGKTADSPAAHPLFVNYNNPSSWNARYYVVGYNEQVTATVDESGKQLRKYEVFLPAPADTNRAGLTLNTSLAEPVAYATIGVSTADDKNHTTDNPKWNASAWGNRYGNEGIVGAPAMIFRVLRERPPAPIPPPDSERVYASTADYHSHSFYTYRWTLSANLKTHIFRSLDNAVFMADWSNRPRPALNAGDLQFFPPETEDPRWNNLKREQVADELNVLNNFPKDETGRMQAMVYYKGLSNDALRVLAGLSGNEKAFSQLTIQPLDPNEPDLNDPTRLRWRDRIGPDNDNTYVPRITLRAYVDTIDGQSTNRYFYRSANVDAAYNISALSISNPPVYIPDVTPPRMPFVTRILGGEQQIILKWASNREEDLVEYRIYRTNIEENARDIRLMNRIHTEYVLSSEPSTRSAEINWIDHTVDEFMSYYYRLTAVDNSGNESMPSPPLMSKAYRKSAPQPPIWNSATVIDENGQLLVRLSWTLVEKIEVIIQRRKSDSTLWTTLATWLPPIVNTYDDSSADLAFTYEYRLKGRSIAGIQTEFSSVMVVEMQT